MVSIYKALKSRQEAYTKNNDIQKKNSTKTRAQAPVTFWGTDPTDHHGILYGLYMHMYRTMMGIVMTTVMTECI